MTTRTSRHVPTDLDAEAAPTPTLPPRTEAPRCSPDDEPRLTTAQVAEHYDLQEATVRGYLRDGTLKGQRHDRDWRVSWRAVWTLENGPMPQGARRHTLMEPLLSKSGLAARHGVSVRTVERWIAGGLPTRDVLTNVRVVRADADLWLKARSDQREAAKLVLRAVAQA